MYLQLQYDDNGEPSEVLMLDFQSTAYCNIGNDLSLLMLSSTTKEFRDKHLDDALKSYHKKLMEVIQKSHGKIPE